MSRKTSIYINPLLEKLIEAHPQPLHEALHRGLAVVPLLIEDGDGFVTHWFCDVPPLGAKFKVHRAHWLTSYDEKPVREIYEIEITQPSSGE